MKVVIIGLTEDGDMTYNMKGELTMEEIETIRPLVGCPIHDRQNEVTNNPNSLQTQVLKKIYTYKAFDEGQTLYENSEEPGSESFEMISMEEASHVMGYSIIWGLWG